MSVFRRLIYCFLIASLIIPIGFNNGHSSGWTIPAAFALVGLFSGVHEEIIYAIEILFELILPATLLLFSFWTVILLAGNKKRGKNCEKE